MVDSAKIRHLKRTVKLLESLLRESNFDGENVQYDGPTIGYKYIAFIIGVVADASSVTLFDTKVDAVKGIYSTLVNDFDLQFDSPKLMTFDGQPTFSKDYYGEIPIETTKEFFRLLSIGEICYNSDGYRDIAAL